MGGQECRDLAAKESWVYAEAVDRLPDTWQSQPGGQPLPLLLGK